MDRLFSSVVEAIRVAVETKIPQRIYVMNFPNVGDYAFIFGRDDARESHERFGNFVTDLVFTPEINIDPNLMDENILDLAKMIVLFEIGRNIYCLSKTEKGKLYYLPECDQPFWILKGANKLAFSDWQSVLKYLYSQDE